MNTKNSKVFVIFVILIMVLASSGCGLNGPRAVIGELQTRSESVELDNAKSVDVDINLGAGKLDVRGGADKLLQADFNYNVAELNPQVSYTDDKLTVHTPDVSTDLISMLVVADYRYDWILQLNDKVPMALHIEVGGGTSNLKLGDLSLSGLDITLGATDGTIDLSGEWAHNLDVTIDAGASNITVILPKDVGVHVVVDRGPTLINTLGLTQDGDVYTNSAYGESGVTMNVGLKTGIGAIHLEEGG